MLPVLADAAVAMAHVALMFPGLPQSEWHVSGHDAVANIFKSSFLLKSNTYLCILKKYPKLKEKSSTFVYFLFKNHVGVIHICMVCDSIFPG